MKRIILFIFLITILLTGCGRYEVTRIAAPSTIIVAILTDTLTGKTWFLYEMEWVELKKPD